MASFADRTQALWRRVSPRARRRLAAVGALLLAWAVAVGFANRPSTRARLRASIRDTLARKLPGAELGDRLTVDPLFRVDFGPLQLRAERKGAPPVFHADRVRVRASLLALLGGRVEAASVRFYGARIQPGEHFAELRAVADRLGRRPDAKPAAAEPVRAAPHDWPSIHLRDATLVLKEGGRELPIGPLDVSIDRRRSADEDDVEVAISHRKGGRAWAQLERAGGQYHLRASALELGPSVLPPALGDGATRWSGGTFSADLSLSGKGSDPASGRVRARLDRGWFAGERLAPDAVGPVTVDLQGALEVDPGERRVALRDASLDLLGVVESRLSASARLGPGFPFSFSFDAPSVDFASLAGALPAPLRPPPDAPAPTGPLAFHFAVEGPLREPAGWTVDASLDLSALREAAKRAPPVPLRSSFTWRPEVEQGTSPAIRIGPENPDFVPLADLPEHVIRAVTTSEDGGFFAHSGFDFVELRNAFAQGTEVGHVVRGASTITQQLAKNLFLSREKTLARKAREAMVAIGLEASIPKARLLEIYLNLAEWGPGIWGIGPAARHYFGKPARELSIREAAFLASIIPNPIRFHYYYTRGELDDAWNERLRVLLLHMAEQGSITEDQLVEALDAPLRFANRTAALDPAALEVATPDPAAPAPAPATPDPAAAETTPQPEIDDPAPSPATTPAE